jgi:hypothetical protein
MHIFKVCGSLLEGIDLINKKEAHIHEQDRANSSVHAGLPFPAERKVDFRLP